LCFAWQLSRAAFPVLVKRDLSTEELLKLGMDTAKQVCHLLLPPSFSAVSFLLAAYLRAARLCRECAGDCLRIVAPAPREARC
jgi:hypothetical protein